MKYIINTLFFLFIFFLFKEITYIIFDFVDFNENQIFIGEPKDMLLMQGGVLAFTIFMVFLFYFIESFYNKVFINIILGKIVILIVLLIAQLITISIVLFFKTNNVLNIYPKTYLSALGISAFTIILITIAIIFILAPPHRFNERKDEKKKNK